MSFPSAAADGNDRGNRHRVKKNAYVLYGYTSDLKRRCIEHGEDGELRYYEAYKDESDARDRERKLKHYGNTRMHLKRHLCNSLK